MENPNLSQFHAAATESAGIAPEPVVQEVGLGMHIAQNSGPVFGPTNVLWPTTPRPSLMQQSAAAADMGGIALEPTVQEARPAGQYAVPSGISMREFIDVDSMLVAFVQPNGTQNSGTKIGPTNFPCHEENPSLTQLRAAATTAGFAPKPVVQEAGTGPNITRPSISMRE